MLSALRFKTRTVLSKCVSVVVAAFAGGCVASSFEGAGAALVGACACTSKVTAGAPNHKEHHESLQWVCKRLMVVQHGVGSRQTSDRCTAGRKLLAMSYA